MKVRKAIRPGVIFFVHIRAVQYFLYPRNRRNFLYGGMKTQLTFELEV